MFGDRVPAVWALGDQTAAWRRDGVYRSWPGGLATSVCLRARGSGVARAVELRGESPAARSHRGDPSRAETHRLWCAAATARSEGVYCGGDDPRDRIDILLGKRGLKA